MTSTTPGTRTVLVTGANGYIGKAVAQEFQKAGFEMYGLIRSTKSSSTLEETKIIPIIGSAADSAAVVSDLQLHTSALDVIVSTTEDTKNYVPHFEDTVALLRALSQVSNNAGVRPLVLFTSGVKDYGRSGLEGFPDLVMQTEESPVNPPPFLAARATHATKVLDEETFDAAVPRPSHVHGHTSSYLGQFFEWAQTAKSNDEPLRISAAPRTLLQSINVDDCGEAYVALANHPDRSQVKGQIFNISTGQRYETVGAIADAVAKLYHIEEGVVFSPPDPARLDEANPLLAFSQLVSSDKIRNLTGWKERRPMFINGLAEYRREWEDAR